MKAALYFADDQVRQTFFTTPLGKGQRERIYDQLNGVFDIIATDPFCGIQVPKRLIPKVYLTNTGLTTFGNLISIRTGG